MYTGSYILITRYTFAIKPRGMGTWVTFNSFQRENNKFNDYLSEINGQSRTLNGFIAKIRPFNKCRTNPIKLIAVKNRVK